MKKIVSVWDRLKFAKKDAQIYGWITIVLGVIAAVLLIMTILYNAELISYSELFAVILMALPMSVIAFVGALGLYLDAKIYISDLDKKGYIVPETRRDCDYRLSTLLRDEQEPPAGKINKRYLVLAIAIATITVLTAIYMFTLAKRPHPLVLLIMLFMTVVILLQSFNRLFKNDIDIDVFDSRWVRQRIVPAVIGVLIWLSVMWVGVGLVSSMFPFGGEIFYAQIVRYYKRENPEDYRFYMDRLPSYATDVEFITWGKACGVTFFVPRENVKDIQAYFEGTGEPYVIHTIEEGEEEFIALCEDIKESTTYFDSVDYANCMVYEFPEWYVDQWGHTASWYAIMDTNSGEVGYGYCPTDW